MKPEGHQRKRKEKKMEKGIKDITAAFFDEEQKEETAKAEPATEQSGADQEQKTEPAAEQNKQAEPAPAEEQEEARTPRTADRSRRVVKDAKSARLNLLIRPKYKEALKNIAKSHKQSVNDLINDLIEKYVDDEEIKAERKKK